MPTTNDSTLNADSNGTRALVNGSLVDDTNMTGIDHLLAVTARLRHPTEGCPWDVKQTHGTLRRYMLEEAYEAVEAMSELEEATVVDSSEAPIKPLEAGQSATQASTRTQALQALKEELGDVLLQVTLHSQIASEAGHFDFDAVCRTLSEKLIRRHPHVFAPEESQGIESAGDVQRQWAKIKQAEKQAKAGNVSSEANSRDSAPESILKGISQGQPALSRALETSRRAVKVGFKWPDLDSLWACVMSEYDEFRAEVPAGAFSSDGLAADVQDRLESEMGDILFASVCLARQYSIDPEVALTRATAKFTRRFQQMEALIHERGQTMDSLDFEAWNALWKEAKQSS